MSLESIVQGFSEKVGPFIAFEAKNLGKVTARMTPPFTISLPEEVIFPRHVQLNDRGKALAVMNQALEQKGFISSDWRQKPEVGASDYYARFERDDSGLIIRTNYPPALAEEFEDITSTAVEIAKKIDLGRDDHPR